MKRHVDMKTSHTIFLCAILLCLAHTCRAQNFDKFFVDKTLRLDYTLSGTDLEQTIALDQLSTFKGWYGKRQRLAEVPVEGYGQIVVRDHRSGDVIFRNSFSTLFQEWQSYPEAKDTRRSFEQVCLMPMPKDTVDVTLQLMNNRRQVSSSFTHTVVPTDILIRRLAEDQTTPYTTIQQAADTSRCIRIAFIAEGYQEGEMNIFLDDAKAATEAIFDYEPFKSMRDRFSIVAVKSPSKDSGTSIPSKGIWLDTALKSNFCTFYSERYLTTLHLKTMHNWLAGIPYEHIIVLVNTSNYGGGGILNFYNLSMTHHPSFKPVVVHEFGHSFAGLGDEYAYEQEEVPMYPHDVEPWEQNITTLVDFNGKWENLIKKGTPIPTPATGKADELTTKVGVYEGAGYSTKGVYRGTQDCRMRTNESPEFCPVCRQAIRRLIDFYTR